MTTDISATLKEVLFDRPQIPYGREEDFDELAGRTFPDRDEFLEFLACKDSDQKIKLAKSILLSLSFSVKIAPPNKLLLNLLDYESQVSGSNAGTGFVPRDHFLHLVNLYLIGIYGFWYSRHLHNDICRQFRANLPTHSRQKVLGTFIDAWKTFVLFHDLGNPLESPELLEDGKRCATPFLNLQKFAANDSALYVLSLLLALEGTIGGCEETLASSIEKLQRKQSCRPAIYRAIEAKVIRNCGAYTRLTESTDIGLARLVQKLMGSQNTIVVVESRQDDRPCASTRTQLNDLLANTEFRALKPLPNPRQILDWARSSHGFQEFQKRFRLAFYFKNLKFRMALFTSLATSSQVQHLDAPTMDFQQVARRFIESLPPSPGGLDFSDYVCTIFKALLKDFDFDDLDRASVFNATLARSLNRKEHLSLHRTVVKETVVALEELLTRKADEIDRAKLAPGDNLEEYVKQLFDAVEITSLPSILTARFSTGVKNRVLYKSTLYKYYRKLAEPIRQCLVLTPSVFEKRGHDIIPIFQDQGLGAVGKKTFSLLSERGLSDLDQIRRYRPKRASKAENFCDHGVAGGLVFATSFNSNIATLHVTGGRGLFKTPSACIELLLGSRGELDALGSEIGGDLTQTIAAEVMYALIIHNLYPASFTEAYRGFRTDRKSNPFAFFCLFSDCLQHWDRRVLMNQGKGFLPYSVAGMDFNIRVEGNKFQISEKGPRLRLEAREEDLRGVLDSFLIGGSDLVRLSLTEW